MIPPEFIDEVLARTDIVEIIEPRVTLKKTGQNYSGLCPFHNEKTPSFSVSQEKQFYYCFGCQASGSAIKFLMEFDRMEFIPAVEYLADRVGLQVPQSQSRNPEASKKRKSLYEILDQSADFYKEQLRNHADKERAVGYLKQRGLTGEIARDFAIGFAPPGWNNLMSALATTNADRQLLIDSGMLTEHADEDKVYDRFRDRIMFPIRDMRGRTIAFGGRVLDDEAMPKYLNSPETEVFHKGRELYGLYEARKKVRNLSRLLVVEGYMDVVALAQHGVRYSVATLGTATSTDHIERMFRMVPQIVFCFDGDNAGRNAAWKALRSTLPAMQDGCDAKFLFLPDGEDPDSMIRSEGQSKFEERIESAIGFTEFFFESLSGDLDVSSMEGKAALSKLAVPYIGQMPEGVLKQLVIGELSSRTGLDAERLVGVTGLDQSVTAREPQPIVPQRTLSQTKLAEHVTMLLLLQPGVVDGISEAQIARLKGEPAWQLLVELIEKVRAQTTASTVVLLTQFQDTPYFDYLKRLAEQDSILSREQMIKEFEDTLERMLNEVDSEQKQRVIDQLKVKSPSELTPEERQLLAGWRKPSM